MRLVEIYRRFDRRCMAVLAPWIYLLLPGIALHEFAHAWVGRCYGDVAIDWTRPQVHIDWDDGVPVWGVVGFLFAPLVIGGLSAFAIPFLLPIVPTAVEIWLVCNWLLLAGPSVVDVRGLVFILTSGDRQ